MPVLSIMQKFDVLKNDVFLYRPGKLFCVGLSNICSMGKSVFCRIIELPLFRGLT